jgi:Flp pilus assembly protein TadG
VVTIVTRRKNPRPRRDEGVAAVEAALILPILILAILGIMEFGTAFWQWNTMLLAVEQAGRYVMVNNAYSSNPPGCTGTLVSCAETQMQAVLTNASVCTTPSVGQVCVNASTSAGTPSTMTLTAAYSFNLLALFAPFTITSQGTVPLD